MYFYYYVHLSKALFFNFISVLLIQYITVYSNLVIFAFFFLKKVFD